MNRLVLIGNGFDLAHDLKTSYEDFIYWYWKQRVSGLQSVDSQVSDDSLCNLEIKGGTWSHWSSLFSSSISKKSGKELYLYFNEREVNFKITHTPFFYSIHQSIETKGWVDIENDYYSQLERRISQIKNYTEKDIEALNLQLDIIKKELLEYLEQEQKKETSTLAAIKDKIYKPIALREMSVSFKNMLEKSTLEDVSPQTIMLLNFNYTRTPERYVTDKSKVAINYIHGKIGVPKSVIFGYGDELDGNYKRLQDLNENECLRHIKSIHYLESDNYRKVLEFIESGRFQVVIMGHSCGISDRTLLNTIFEHKNCISIKPYFYQKDGKDNYLDLVMNISRNFTDMKLMRDRVVNKEYCELLVNN